MQAFQIAGPQEFIKMTKSGKLAAAVLQFIEPHVVPGVTTDALNELCHNFIIEHQAIPAPLNYRGFPKSICTSVNHVVCHGIPSAKKLVDGDIINIDITVVLDGWYGDTSKTFLVGSKVTPKAKKLCQVAYDSMMLAIEQVRPGVPLNLIGKAIEEYATKHGCSVVRDFCGHGIGRVFHAAPNVLHYFDPRDQTILQEGMMFTIEPMINAGAASTKVLADGWTAVTRDRSLSAQFEHTVGVSSQGCQIFTLL